MTDKNTQHDSPRDRTDQGHRGRAGDRTQNPTDRAPPEMPETERGGSHGAQSTSRINEDEGTSGGS